jgi:hypothetical protein
VVVINATTDTVETSFPLGDKVNPMGMFQPTPTDGVFGGDLLLPMVDFAVASNSCLARVGTTGTLRFNGCAVDNTQLDGYVNRVDVTPDGTAAWLAVFHYSDDFSTKFGHLRAVNLTTGAMGEPFTPESGAILDVAACPGGYMVATAETGLRIWHDGTETTATPLALGRRPNGPNSLICF